MIHKKQAILPLLLFSFLVSGWVAIPETEIKALSTEIKSKPTSIAATQVENSPELQVPVTTRIVFMYVLSGFDQFSFTFSNAKRCSIKEISSQPDWQGWRTGIFAGASDGSFFSPRLYFHPIAPGT